MSFDGNGNYSVPSGTQAVPGTTIDSAKYNALLSDLQTALSKAVLRDGQSSAQANLGMGNFRLLSLGPGVARTDSVNFGQIQDGVATLLTSVVGTNAITASLTTPTLTSYSAGLRVALIPTALNTGAVTININGIGAVAVTTVNGAALVGGDLLVGGAYELMYDGTKFQVITGILRFTDTNIVIPGTITTNSVKEVGVNVGIGAAAPVYKLDVSTVTGDTQAGVYDRAAAGSSAARIDLRTSGTGASQWFLQTGNTASGLNGSVRLFNQATGIEAWRSDTAGNTGFGLAPSPWNATYKVLQLPSMALFTDSNSNYTSNNIYIDSGGAFRYIGTKFAMYYTQNAFSGAQEWYSAPSGPAGTIPVFTLRKSLDASGNLFISGAYSGAGTNLTGTANSLNAGIGVNQTWQNMNASRALATSYTNSTGKPIMVSITNQGPTQTTLSLTVGGIAISIGGVDSSGSNNGNSVCGIVPNGATYSCTGGAFTTWAELR